MLGFGSGDAANQLPAERIQTIYKCFQRSRLKMNSSRENYVNSSCREEFVFNTDHILIVEMDDLDAPCWALNKELLCSIPASVGLLAFHSPIPLNVPIIELSINIFFADPPKKKDELSSIATDSNKNIP